MNLINFTWCAKIDAAPHQYSNSDHCVCLLALATCPIIDSWLSFLWCIRVSQQLVSRCISLFSVIPSHP